MPGFEESYRFRTEIIESRRGNEQRIAQRVNPRRTFRYVGRIRPEDLPGSLATILRDPGGAFFVPHFEKATALLASAVKATQNFVPQTIPPWMVPGRGIYLGGDRAEDLYTVVAVDNAVVSVLQPFRRDYSKGEGVLRAALVRRTEPARSSFRTSRVTEPRFEVDEDPVQAWHRDFGTEFPESFRGAEYFDLAPNWASPAQVTAGSRWDNLDFRRGAVDRLFPVPYPTRLVRLSFVLQTEDRLNKLLGLFYRSRGRQKSFYFVSPAHELNPLDLGDETYDGGITVKGVGLRDAYYESTVYRRVVIRTREGNLIATIADIVETDGGNSHFVLTPALRPALSFRDIRSVSWLTRSRFETDRLDIDWRTSTVGESTVVIRSLEDD